MAARPPYEGEAEQSHQEAAEARAAVLCMKARGCSENMRKASLCASQTC